MAKKASSTKRGPKMHSAVALKSFVEVPYIGRPGKLLARKLPTKDFNRLKKQGYVRAADNGETAAAELEERTKAHNEKVAELNRLADERVAAAEAAGKAALATAEAEAKKRETGFHAYRRELEAELSDLKKLVSGRDEPQELADLRKTLAETEQKLGETQTELEQLKTANSPGTNTASEAGLKGLG